MFRSNKHLVLQVIDDDAGRTLAVGLDQRGRPACRGHRRHRRGRRRLGQLVAERAKAAGVDKVVFDRGGFVYHGRIAAVAAAAREAGLEF